MEKNLPTAFSTIWKYTLPTTVNAVMPLDLPVGSKFLHVDMQGTSPCIWVQVPILEDTSQQHEIKTHLFQLVETGKKIPHDWHHLGTLLLMRGDYVLHIFTDKIF